MFKVIPNGSPEEQSLGNQIKKWKELPPLDTTPVFLEFFEEQGQGNSNYPNQWSKIQGINYGTTPIPCTVLNKIIDASTVWLHLGITENSEGPSFNIIFQTVNDNGEEHYISDDSFNTYIYDIEERESHSKQRFGISPELRNRLAYDWLIWAMPLESAFYALTPKKMEGNEQNTSLSRIGNHSWVRVHKFGVTHHNLDMFKQSLGWNPDTAYNCENLQSNYTVNVHFGLTPSNYLIDKPMFNIIVKITEQSKVANPEIIATTYLDFVGACPPACSGNGGTA